MNDPLSTFGAFLTGAVIFGCAATVTPPTGDGTVSVGTFDSRAVAIAYARSDMARESMAGLMAEFEQAKLAGDTERVAELEAIGKERQAELHLQGFSTGSVAGYLELVEAQLPGIARQAGVELLVSKWDLVYRDPSAQTHDVTELLVEAFDPDDATRKACREILEHDPVPPDQLDHEH
jgi:hypothetical protein